LLRVSWRDAVERKLTVNKQRVKLFLNESLVRRKKNEKIKRQTVVFSEFFAVNKPEDARCVVSVGS